MKYDLTKIYNNIKSSAKKRGIEFNITKTDLDDIGIPLTCPILGIPIKFNKLQCQDDSISLDRIDSSKGYIKGNIQFISLRANRIKSDATLTELKKLLEYYEYNI